MTIFKKVLMTAAIATSVIGAWATRPAQDCTGVQQYYWTGSAYAPAGTYGHDYLCMDGAGTCTYYTAGTTYQPCRPGVYTSLHAHVTIKK